MHAIQSEILARGPVAATINAEPIVEYSGGIFKEEGHSQSTNHIVSIVGWGEFEDSNSSDDSKRKKKTFWYVRNSWGQYWGEMGYMRIEAGKNLLGLEGEVAWATPGAFTVHNFPCHEDGKNCDFHKGPSVATQYYVDPSEDKAALEKHLKLVKKNSSPKMAEEKRYIRTEAA